MIGSGDARAWLDCPEVALLLARLDGELKRAIGAPDVDLRAMAGQTMGFGGKRLRPALLFLAASFGRPSDEETLRAAAALELLHAASLCHDDVMDRAESRRHEPSANIRWGNNSATLTGTFLFARATSLLADLGDTVNRFAADACAALCSGQLLEVDNAYNTGLSEPRRLEILRRKTATLFELPCRLGAYLGGVDTKHGNLLAAYGRDLGLAFQLADDALDVEGDPSTTGKAIGTDLRQGVYSIPVVRALNGGGPIAQELRDLLMLAQLKDGDIARALALVQASGAIQDVLSLARRQAARATRRLTAFAQGTAQRSLRALAAFAVSRAH